MPADQSGYVAGGNIHAAAFVKKSTTADNTILEATAGSKTFGIITKATDRPPFPGLDTVYAAQLGESVRVHLEGEVCDLQISGTVAADDFLKPTTNGYGITTTTDKDWYGAQAIRAGVSGDIIQVYVKSGYLSV